MAITIAASNSANSGGNALTHTVTLPTGIVNGSRVRVYFANDGAGVTASVTTPATGWTRVHDLVVNSTTSAARLSVFERNCDGTEGATIVVTVTASEAASWISRRYDGHAADASESTAVTTPTNANPNPPSETASWGSEASLWEVIYAWDTGTVTHTTYPANYTDNQVTTAWANTGGVGIASASRAQTAATDDPGTATISASEQWAAITYVTRQSTGAPVTVSPGVLALILTEFAPTVTASDHKSVTPGVLALTITEFAPTVTASDHKSVTPSTAALALTTFAPTVTASAGGAVTVTPSTLALSMTAFAPTTVISDHKVVTPTTKVLTLTAFAPVVTATNHQIVTPGPLGLTLTGFAPSVIATGQEIIGGLGPIIASTRSQPRIGAYRSAPIGYGDRAEPRSGGGHNE